MDRSNSLAALLIQRNAIDQQIERLLQHPASPPNLAEHLAAEILGIQLRALKNHKSDDGEFVQGPSALIGSTVNVKYSVHKPDTLDLPEDWQKRQREETLPAFYLAIRGAAQAGRSSKGKHHPFVITSLHLFETQALLAALLERQTQRRLHHRDLKIGGTTSVYGKLWEAAEIFPRAHNAALALSREQRSLLLQFSGHDAESLSE